MMSEIPQLEDIRRLEEALHRPDVRRSPEAVEQLLAPDFFEFGSSGRVYRREQTIRLLAEESEISEAAAPVASDYVLTVIAPGAVLLTYLTRRQDADGEGERQTLRSSIWTWSDGQWRMAFHQGTPRNT
ncbi:MAG: hypothetical protein BGN83_11540 [Rhizobium sp. 63-7]|nr:MAG: hypothetical protein BGN83_11540 [Rhizobium sp. 63-7]